MGRKRTKIFEASPLGENITQLRKTRGLTIKELGTHLGITESYISYIETGARKPNRDMIAKLVRYFFPDDTGSVMDEWLMLGGFSPQKLNPLRLQHEPLRNAERDLHQGTLSFHQCVRMIRELIRSGQYERAQNQIQHALQTFHATVQIQALVSSLELAKGNYEAARISQQTALQLLAQLEADPDPVFQSDLWLTLGVIHFMKASPHLQRYHISLSQGNPLESEKSAAWSSFSESRFALEKSLEYVPGDIYILDELARVQFNLASLTDPSEAQSLWQATIAAFQAVVRHPDDVVLEDEARQTLAVFLGHSYAKAGQFEQAEDVLRVVRLCRPEFWLGHYALACLYSLKLGTNMDERWYELGIQALNQALMVGGVEPVGMESLHDVDLTALREWNKTAFLQMIKQNGETLSA